MTDINNLTADQISERLQSAGFHVENGRSVATDGSMHITHVSLSFPGIVVNRISDRLAGLFDGEKVRIVADSNNEVINIYPIK